jgi:hypothetical protein
MNRLFGGIVTLILSAAMSGCTLMQSTAIPTPMLPATAAPTIAPAGTQVTRVPLEAVTTGPTFAADSEQSAFGGVGIGPATAAPTAGPRQVKIFMVALEDNGQSGEKIGCNDSLIPVSREVPVSPSPLTDTLTLLFSLKSRDYGQSGLYNALYQSNLKVEGISAHDGVFRVNLIGTVQLGGVCDNPRFVNQIRATVMQFATVKQANIFINGKSLESYLSEAGQ